MKWVLYLALFFVSGPSAGAWAGDAAAGTFAGQPIAMEPVYDSLQVDLPEPGESAHGVALLPAVVRVAGCHSSWPAHGYSFGRAGYVSIRAPPVFQFR